MRDVTAQVRGLSSGWWGAAAGAAAAGAVIVPGHRILAAVIGGAAVLAIALWQSAGCGCHDSDTPPLGPGLEGTSVAAPAHQETWAELLGGLLTPNAAAQGCGCS